MEANSGASSLVCAPEPGPMSRKLALLFFQKGPNKFSNTVMDYVSYMIKIVMFSSFQKHIVCIGLFCL